MPNRYCTKGPISNDALILILVHSWICAQRRFENRFTDLMILDTFFDVLRKVKVYEKARSTKWQELKCSADAQQLFQ